MGLSRTFILKDLLANSIHNFRTFHPRFLIKGNLILHQSNSTIIEENNCIRSFLLKFLCLKSFFHLYLLKWNVFPRFSFENIFFLTRHLCLIRIALSNCFLKKSFVCRFFYGRISVLSNLLLEYVFTFFLWFFKKHITWNVSGIIFLPENFLLQKIVFAKLSLQRFKLFLSFPSQLILTKITTEEDAFSILFQLLNQSYSIQLIFFHISSHNVSFRRLKIFIEIVALFLCNRNLNFTPSKKLLLSVVVQKYFYVAIFRLLSSLAGNRFQWKFWHFFPNHHQN